ncbi:MAG TPA: hypothetical protein PKW17_12645 [Smithellaceae bacterium]|nr:hypothetical protein [Smithellaceae bacterium]HRS90320.1 hypothetical protein [Smithellaceae bacterium]
MAEIISTSELLEQEKNRTVFSTKELTALDEQAKSLPLKTSEPEPAPFDVDDFIRKDAGGDPEEYAKKGKHFAAAMSFFVKPWQNLGYSSAASLNRGMAYFSEGLDTIADMLADRYGVQKGGIFESAAKTYEQNTEYWQRKAEANGITFMTELFGEALGGAVPGIAEFALNVPYAALHGAAKAHKEGGGEFAGALTEAAKRGVLGLVFRSVHPLKQYLRAPVFGAVFGAQTAAEGGDTKEIAKGVGTGFIYSMFSPGGRYGLREVRENIKKEYIKKKAAEPKEELTKDKDTATLTEQEVPIYEWIKRQPEFEGVDVAGIRRRISETGGERSARVFDLLEREGHLTAERRSVFEKHFQDFLKVKEAHDTKAPAGSEGKHVTPELQAYYESRAEAIKKAGAKESREEITFDQWRETPEGKAKLAEVAAFAPEKNFRRKPERAEATDEITRRSDLVRFLSEKMDIPIRTGRFHDKALGIFKLKDEVIRTKQANDIEVIAHEVGHAIQKYLYPEATTAQGLSSRPFSAYEKELTPLATKPKAGQEVVPEGFAEFIRLYVTDPKKAQDKAPSFYKFFEKELQNKSPETLEILKSASAQYDRWLKQPALQRILSQVSVGEKNARHTNLDDLYTATIDDLFPLKKTVDAMSGGKPPDVAQDPYALARLHRGYTGKAETFLKHRPFKFKTYEDVGKSFEDIIRPMRDDLDPFRAYIVAKRAIELEKRGIETGILKEDARDIINQYDRKFKKAFDELKEYQDHTLNYLKDSGMIDEATYQKIKVLNEDYVPLYRVMEEGGKKPGVGAGLTARNPLKKIKGSWRDIQDPLESVIKNTYLYIAAAEKNSVGRALVDLAEKTEGMGKFLEKIPKPMQEIKIKPEELQRMGLEGIPEETVSIFRPSAFTPKDNVISVWREGKQELYEVHPDIAKVFQALDKENTTLLMRVLSKPASWLRAGATLTPEFILRNPARDQLTAYVYSKYGYKPLVDLTRGVFSMAKKDKLYWDFKKGGADHSMLVSMDRDYLQHNLGELLTKYPVINYVKHPIEALRILSEIGEQGTRLGEFKKGVKKEGVTKEGIQKAALAAREITLDFNRKGTIGKSVNMITAFWNAQIQGMDKMAREFKNNPITTTMKTAAAITLPSVLLAIATHDDERIKELPAWQRDLFWCVPTENHIWRIPKPFELGILFGSFPERVTHWILEKDPHAFDGLLKGVVDAAAPGFVPTAAIPIMENWANKSLFFDRPIIPPGRTELLPEYQYGPHTTETAKELGKLLGRLPWMDNLPVAAPGYIENLVRGWTGGLGTYALNILDLGLRASGITPEQVEKPTLNLSDMPVIKAFHVRYPSANTASITRFYDNYKKIEQSSKTIKVLLNKERDPEAAIRLMEAGAMENLSGHYTAIRNIHNLIDAIYTNPIMTGDEKREYIDMLYMQMIGIAKNGNELVDMIRKQKKELDKKKNITSIKQDTEAQPAGISLY